MKLFYIISAIAIAVNPLRAEVIRFRTRQEAESARSAMIQFIWGESGPPTRRVPDSIAFNIQDPFYASLMTDQGNLAGIDMYVIDLGYGLTSTIRHLHARVPNGRLFIYHSGHSPGGPEGEDANINNNLAPGKVIPAMLRNGYDVLTVAMPLYGNTNPTVAITPDHSEQFIYHAQIFAYLPHPYTYFFDPLYITLNYLEDHYHYRSISMTGLSGGGWTTALYQAIDQRIMTGFAVAGSVPLDLRPGFEGLGDTEQGFDYNGLYGVVNYQEIYCLASMGEGRRHVQILNRYDDQTFWGERQVFWVDSVTSAMNAIGSGSYKFYLDEVARRHTISDYALNIILDTLTDRLPDVPVAVNPPDGAVINQSICYIDWLQSNRATSFRFQLAADSTFQHGLVCDSTIEYFRSEDSLTLKKSGTLYWHVAASNASGMTAWSPARSISLPNSNPIITSLPSQSALVEESSFNYRLSATDADSATFGDVATYQFPVLPSWLSYDSRQTMVFGAPPVGAQDTSVSVIASDGRGGSAQQSFPIHVIHVNHPPVIMSAPAATAAEDSLYRYAIWAQDKDSAAFHDHLHYRMDAAPQWLSIDSVTGVLSGRPSGTDVGQSAVRVIVTDDAQAPALQSYTLTVKHTNHRPRFLTVRDTSIVEDVSFTGRIMASDSDTPLFGDVVHYRILSRPAWLKVDSLSGVLTGTPDITALKDTIFVMQAYDDSGASDVALMTVHIRHVNHAPAIVHSAFPTAKEDTLWRCRINASDKDTLIGDRLIYRCLQKPGWITIDSLTGVLSGVPGRTSVGVSRLIVRVDDNSGASAFDTSDVTVLHTNHPPMLLIWSMPVAYEDSLYAVQIQATDPDSAMYHDVIHYSIEGPRWLSVDPNTGLITGIPRAADVKPDRLTIDVEDQDFAEDSRRMDLPIQHVNHPPVMLTVPSNEAKEDSLYRYSFKATDSDTLFGDTIHYRVGVRPAWMTYDSSTQTLSGIPAAVNVGDTAASDLADDGKGGIVEQRFAIHVKHTNHPPTITSLPDTMATEDVPYHCRFTADDIDRALFKDTLTVTFSAKPSWLQFNPVTWNLDGTPSGVNARDTVVAFTVSDGAGGTAGQSFMLHVTPVNHPPSITSSAPSAAYEDSAYSYPIRFTDPDITFKHDTVALHLVSGPSWLKLNAQQSVLYGKPEGYNLGDTIVAVEARDRWNAADTQSWKLTVHPVQYAPSPSGLLFPKTITESGLHIASDDIRFGWRCAHDRNLRDSLLYRVHCWRERYDTLSAWQRDTTWILHWEQGTTSIRDFNWSVMVTDGIFTVAMQDTITVIVKNATSVTNVWSDAVPGDYVVYQNYPNPFNPTTTLRFGVPRQSRVTLEIYNELGQRVESLYRDQNFEPGYYETTWNAAVKASGIFFAVIRAESCSEPVRAFREVKKLLLIR